MSIYVSRRAMKNQVQLLNHLKSFGAGVNGGVVCVCVCVSVCVCACVCV